MRKDRLENPSSFCKSLSLYYWARGMNLTKNWLIVVITVVFVVGIGTAYAGMVLPIITFEGDVNVTEDLDVTGSITSPTITDFEDRITALEGEI